MSGPLLRQLADAEDLGLERGADGIQQIGQRRVVGPFTRCPARRADLVQVIEVVLDGRREFLVRSRHSPLAVPLERTFSNPGAEAMLLHRAEARHLEGQPYCPHPPAGGRSSAEPRRHHRCDAPAAPPG